MSKNFTTEEVEEITGVINNNLDRFMPKMATVLQQWEGLQDFKFTTMNKLIELEYEINEIKMTTVKQDVYSVDLDKMLKLSKDL